MTNYFWAVGVNYPDDEPFIVEQLFDNVYLSCGTDDGWYSHELIILEPVVPCKKKSV